MHTIIYASRVKADPDRQVAETVLVLYSLNNT